MTFSADFSQADFYPLIRSGGAFLLLLGAAMLTGGLAFRFRYAILAAGAAIGAVTLVLLARPLAAPHGAPDALALLSIGAGIALQIVLLAVLPRRFSAERGRTLAVLAIVAVHFLVMAPAFGPLIVALGALLLVNALLGAANRGYCIVRLWAVDGALKAGFGAAMWFAHRLPAGPVF
jgi:hypothetical protein